MEIISRKTTSRDLINLLTWLALSVGVAVMGLPVYRWFWERWMAYESYYSHGPLVLGLAIVALIYHLYRDFRIRGLPEPLARGGKAGWVAVLFVSLLYLISSWIKVYFLLALSVWLSVLVVLRYSLEAQLWRKIRFWVFFSLLAIPLPMVFLEQVALHLKSVSAVLAGKLLSAIGIATKVVGNRIFTARAQLEVGAPCSGLRSIVSLMAIALLLGRVRRWRTRYTLMLVLLSPLVAFLGNVFRVLSLGFVADVYGVEVALGRFHDALGYVVFGLDLIGLLIVAHLLSAVASKKVGEEDRR